MRKIDDELNDAKHLEECMCRCGTPRGSEGIIEKVFRGRKSNDLRCKVVMDSGTVKYFSLIDIYPF